MPISKTYGVAVGPTVGVGVAGSGVFVSLISDVMGVSAASTVAVSGSISITSVGIAVGAVVQAVIVPMPSRITAKNLR